MSDLEKDLRARLEARRNLERQEEQKAASARLGEQREIDQIQARLREERQKVRRLVEERGIRDMVHRCIAIVEEEERCQGEFKEGEGPRLMRENSWVGIIHIRFQKKIVIALVLEPYLKQVQVRVSLLREMIFHNLYMYTPME